MTVKVMATSPAVRFGYSFRALSQENKPLKGPGIRVSNEVFMWRTAQNVAKIAPQVAEMMRYTVMAKQIAAQIKAQLTGKPIKPPAEQVPQPDDPIFFIIGNSEYMSGAYLDGMDEAMRPIFKDAGIDTAMSAEGGILVNGCRLHQSSAVLRQFQLEAETLFPNYKQVFCQDVPKNTPSEPEKGYVVSYNGKIQPIDL